MRTSAGKRGIDRDAASSLVNIKAARPNAPVGRLKAVRSRGYSRNRPTSGYDPTLGISAVISQPTPLRVV